MTIEPKPKPRQLARRDVLRAAAGAVLTTGAASCKDPQPSPSANQESAQQHAAAGEPLGHPYGKKPKVVLIRDADALDEAGKPRAEVLARMLDEAVVKLLGASDRVAAFKQLVKPGDTVGIKSNVWRHLPTPPELEQALRQRVIDAGVAADRIAIDDRGVRGNPVFQRATALINVRPLRTHHWSGIGSCIKNYIMFSDSPPDYHPDSCAGLARLWSLPEVKGKTRLNILVMLTPQFHSKGPHNFQKRYTWPYKGLIVGQDPVAVDATGLRILEAQRREHFGSDRPLYVPAKHVAVADRKYQLGIADAQKIEITKLGWMDRALI
jgi:hypothetical protein